jgi:hypothetical protein
MRVTRAPYVAPNVVGESGRRILVQTDAMQYRPRRVLGAVSAESRRGIAANSPYQKDSWAGDDEEVIIAANNDDSAGNGIFDSSSAPAVQHAGNGVFEARYAEPGFLYRERLTEPGSIMDQRTGNPIISLPAGTSWPSELAEAYRPWDKETPRYYDKGLSGLGAIPTMEGRSPVEFAVAGLILGAAVAVLQKAIKARRGG